MYFLLSTWVFLSVGSEATPPAYAEEASFAPSPTSPEPSPSQIGLSKRGFAALLTNLDWKKDKKRILLMAGGALLGVVIVVLIPCGSADANGNSESR